MLENFFTSLLVAVRIGDRVKFGRVLCDTCQSCTFGQIQIPYIFVEILSSSCLYTVGSSTKVNCVQIVLKDSIFAGFLFNLNGKVLFLKLTCESLKLSRLAGPVCEYVILQKLLSNCTGTLGKISGGDSFYSCTENTFHINTIMFIKSFILNGDYCMLQIYRNLIQSNWQSVRIRCGQLTDLISGVVVKKCCIAQRHNINIIHIRSIIDHASE